MTDAVNRFYNSIEGASSLNQTALIELFLYHLTVELGQESAKPKELAACFSGCDLQVPGNIAARLSDGLKGNPSKYLKTQTGYKLQRHMRDAISRRLGAETVIIQTSATLRSLEHRLPSGADKEFLKESIDCFEAGANRATIVMTWILAMDHLFAYILAHRLAEFNAALAKDKGVKLDVVAQRDDFTEIKETKFIELCRAAGIISNDMRKILDQKLGTRNSSAHPSGVTINKTKVIDFVEDLVDNIVLKLAV